MLVVVPTWETRFQKKVSSHGGGGEFFFSDHTFPERELLSQLEYEPGMVR